MERSGTNERNKNCVLAFSKALCSSSLSPAFKLCIPIRAVNEHLAYLLAQGAQGFLTYAADGRCWNTAIKARRTRDRTEYFLQGWKPIAVAHSLLPGDQVEFELLEGMSLRFTARRSHADIRLDEAVGCTASRAPVTPAILDTPGEVLAHCTNSPTQVMLDLERFSSSNSWDHLDDHGFHEPLVSQAKILQEVNSRHSYLNAAGMVQLESPQSPYEPNCETMHCRQPSGQADISGCSGIDAILRARDMSLDSLAASLYICRHSYDRVEQKCLYDIFIRTSSPSNRTMRQ